MQQTAVEETVYATGALAAQDRAALSAKVPGRVESIRVDLGSKVKKGELLAQIEKRDFELRRLQADAALAQARARLGIALTGEEDEVEPEKTSVVKEARAVFAEATKTRQRTMKLREQGIMPEADVEAAEAQYQVAANRLEEAMQEAKNRMATLKQRQAELAMAEQELKDAEIRAPFDGVVESRQTSQGEFLNVGIHVLTVVRIDPIRMRLEIAEKDASRIRAGQRVLLRLEGSDQAREGTISRLSPVISAGNRMLVAEADFQNPDGALRPGSFAKADIVVNDHSPGLFIPKSSIITFAGMQKVFLVEHGKAVEKEVSLKRQKGEDVEIAHGVKSGDMVVVDPGGLRNGQAVELSGGQS
ncbi:MAG TPA: efflux RND transporter periplasmic adaptor subunit [Verrucomicrobiae bacterium]|nr:efflux RND transporter periplasmic adaptor subunit [Verrucomicrobiae bacterium]